MIWALLVIPFLVALLIGYAINRSMLGKEAAFRNLLSSGLLFLLIIATIISLFFLPQPVQDYAFSGLFIALAIIPWLLILTWPRRKKRAGHLLWNLGWPATHRYLLVASAIFFVTAILQTILFITLASQGFSGSERSVEYYLSQVILFWSCAISFLWIGFSKLEVREKGIYFKFGLIKWQQISSYKWEGKNGNILTVWLKQRLPLFQTRSWLIPSGLKNPVERIILQNMSGKEKITKDFTY